MRLRGPRPYVHASLALAAVLLLALAGGCGRASAPPPPVPTVTGVTPAAGLTAGGTLVTVSGTGFLPGAAVQIGGTVATNVTVLDGGTLTCTTPAGPPGAQAAIQVTTQGGQGLLLGAYFYIPPPNITNVTPSVSSLFGGMQHTLQGSGFQDNAAGPNTVTVDGVPATNVITVSDAIILFTAPAGTPGAADIVVTNANGTDDDPLAYIVPIMAAQAGANFPPWNLYAIEPASGAAYLIGQLAVGIRGMDFSPTGTLYGVTAEGFNTRSLVTIDPATAAVTVIGPLRDPTGLDYIVQEITFVGSTLYATSAWDTTFSVLNSLITIDTATGLLTSVFPNFTPMTVGGAFATDATDTNHYWMGGDWGTLDRIDVLTPAITPIAPLVGGIGLELGGATFHLGTLYAVDRLGGFPSQVFAVDTTTGLLTPVGGSLPPRVSALASPVR